MSRRELILDKCEVHPSMRMGVDLDHPELPPTCTRCKFEWLIEHLGGSRVVHRDE